MRPLVVAPFALVMFASLANGCASRSPNPAPVPQSVRTVQPLAAHLPPVSVAALEDAYDDPSEFRDPETMPPLFAKANRPSFPKATASDRDCWQNVRLSGDAKKDYEVLVAHCGRPTGSVQYVAPVIGKLHAVHDKRDTFIVKLQGGLCYRFFGVADGTIQDLDILIERASGDLVGEDRSNGPVAIIEPDKSWCMATDADLRFKVQVDGAGTGSYEFGVWARPGASPKSVAAR